MKPQCERILRHMQDFGGITSLEALQNYGVMRLASRITDLKAQGVAITSETITGKNRYGEPIHYKRYKLAKEDLK